MRAAQQAHPFLPSRLREGPGEGLLGDAEKNMPSPNPSRQREGERNF